MRMIRVLLAGAVLVAMTSSAFAALSQKYVDFAQGPAQWIMTKDEQIRWKTIANDADAQAFVDLFWARRDPTPATSENEFQEKFDARVKYADEKFGHGKTRGALTDRGHALVVLGGPSRIQRTNPAPSSTIQGPEAPIGNSLPSDSAVPTTIQHYSPKQVWFYDLGKTDAPLTAPTTEVVFIDQYGSEEWKMDRTPKTDIIGVMNDVNIASLKQPSLTAAPRFAAAPTAAPKPSAATAPKTPVVAAAPALPAMGVFKTDALRSAVDDMRAAKQSPYKNIYVSYGEYITPKGEYFVPIQLYVPKGSGLALDQDYTFFGVVEDAAGKPAAIFEEPARLASSRDDLYFAKTLTLSPGKYKGTFGLAQNGKPVTMVAADMSLTGLDKDASGMSSLILSNNVFPLTEAQKPTDPFAFGGIKVIPKSDAVFSTADELWYFFELRNPGLDVGTNLPKVRAKLTVEGKTTEGKSVKYDNPPVDLEPQPLKGVEGHWAVGQSIPLSGFKPGDYTFKMKVTDVIKTQVYEQTRSFKVVK